MIDAIQFSTFAPIPGFSAMALFSASFLGIAIFFIRRSKEIE